MLFKPALGHFCEVVGRASAIVALAGLGSFVFAATAFDFLR
jgi:hypothetical protein